MEFTIETYTGNVMLVCLKNLVMVNVKECCWRLKMVIKRSVSTFPVVVILELLTQLMHDLECIVPIVFPYMINSSMRYWAYLQIVYVYKINL